MIVAVAFLIIIHHITLFRLTFSPHAILPLNLLSCLPNYMMIRFSDAEAARVKSASKLVSSIAASSTGLQEGIFNMSCE